MTTPLTTADLLAQKGQRTWLQLHVDSGPEAAAAVEAGIMVLSCEPDHTLEPIRKAAPGAFISAGMPHGSIADEAGAIRAGFEILRRGANAVYCSHSPRLIEAMAREGIPVTGHVGLVPNLAEWTGFRAVGKTAREALMVLQKLRDLESAGAACVEVEVVPVELAAHLTKSTHMVTMGMGCGTACDTQYLFSSDVLGTHAGHYPRHAKRYADFVRLEAELQAKRVAAFAEFARDVETGGYPAARHEVRMEAREFDAFLSAAEKMERRDG